jgi:ABC-2 type transport system ATP-binding protein
MKTEPIGSEQTALRFEAVRKSYGRTVALDRLDLSVPAGSITGLLGRNGAGKTTALRCLVGLARPDAGTVRLLGEDPWNMGISVKERLGFMSDKGVPFTSARPAQLIALCAPLYPRWDRALEQRIIQRFSIDPKRRLDRMSLGQQRAVALLLAICPRPDVLVLDEPAANLDPVIRREFLEEVLTLLSDAGSTVLLSSHILSDIERVANRVAIMHQGRLLLSRDLEELREQVRRVRLIFPDRAPVMAPQPGQLRSRAAGRELLLTLDHCDEDCLGRLAAETGAEVQAQPVGLEELFIDLTSDTPIQAAA